MIGVSDYGKTEEVIKALELGRACGALTAAFTKRADSPITSAAEFSIDYQADCIWEIHLLLCYSVVLEMITASRRTRKSARSKTISNSCRMRSVIWYALGKKKAASLVNWPASGR